MFLLTFVSITVAYNDCKVNIYVKQNVDLNMQCIRKKEFFIRWSWYLVLWTVVIYYVQNIKALKAFVYLK